MRPNAHTVLHLSRVRGPQHRSQSVSEKAIIGEQWAFIRHLQDWEGGLISFLELGPHLQFPTFTPTNKIKDADAEGDQIVEQGFAW